MKPCRGGVYSTAMTPANNGDDISYSCVHINDFSTLEEFRRLIQMDQRYNASGTTHHHMSINFSLKDALDILREQQNDGRNVSAGAEVLLIVVYSLLIVAGLAANCIVSFVVARRTQMHTARNLYIVNLTISDITLCLVCMPFTLVTLLRRQWTLGEAMCKLIPLVQGTNIMVSIGTITVIALDRYFTIVRRCSQDLASTRRRVVVSIVLIWVISFLATAPLCFFQGLEAFAFHRVVLYEVCTEMWPSTEAKLTYAICVLLIQAVIPALVVCVVHARIAAYLHAHAQSRQDSVDSRRARRELERNRRTTILLSGIAVLFAVSWLPLGMFSVLVDSTQFYTSSHNLYMALAACHVLAMTSAVSNPIVYGWLNSNIRHEFIQLLPNRCSNMLQAYKSHPELKANIGGATTAVEDGTTRTHLTNHPTSVVTTPKPAHRESVTLLLVPTGNKLTPPARETNSIENSIL